MKKIHYIAFYGKLNTERNLYVVPSGVSKMSYIINTIKKSGYSVDILSTAYTKNRYSCHYKGFEEIVDERERIIYIDTFGSRFRLIRALAILWMIIQISAYLIFRVKPNERVIVYHSNIYKYSILFSRIFNKYKLIFEIEELYSVLNGYNPRKFLKEINYLKKGDSFLLVNNLMVQDLDLSNKPYAIVHGKYETIAKKAIKTDNEQINVVYAGGIGKKGTDVFLAADAANFLPDNYKIHLLGFGFQDDINFLLDYISTINRVSKKEKVVYHGCLTGDDYSEFLSRMHIGLNTRVLDNYLSRFTFPSKILAYLSHNIVTISSQIDCVINSEIASSVVFFSENTPESVAEAILSLDLNNTTVDCKIKDLDEKFIEDLRRILNN